MDNVRDSVTAAVHAWVSDPSRLSRKEIETLTGAYYNGTLPRRLKNQIGQWLEDRENRSTSSHRTWNPYSDSVVEDVLYDWDDYISDEDLDRIVSWWTGTKPKSLATIQDWLEMAQLEQSPDRVKKLADMLYDLVRPSGESRSLLRTLVRETVRSSRTCLT